MRQAADILSSAPAMQIRYLEAMQAMAKSANSKVIFLPGSSNQGLDQALKSAVQPGNADAPNLKPSQNVFGDDQGFQQAVNAHVIENI